MRSKCTWVTIIKHQHGGKHRDPARQSGGHFAEQRDYSQARVRMHGI